MITYLLICGCHGYVPFEHVRGGVDRNAAVHGGGAAQHRRLGGLGCAGGVGVLVPVERVAAPARAQAADSADAAVGEAAQPPESRHASRDPLERHSLP